MLRENWAVHKSKSDLIKLNSYHENILNLCQKCGETNYERPITHILHENSSRSSNEEVSAVDAVGLLHNARRSAPKSDGKIPSRMRIRKAAPAKQSNIEKPVEGRNTYQPGNKTLRDKNNESIQEKIVEQMVGTSSSACSIFSELMQLFRNNLKWFIKGRSFVSG